MSTIDWDSRGLTQIIDQKMWVDEAQHGTKFIPQVWSERVLEGYEGMFFPKVHQVLAPDQGVILETGYHLKEWLHGGLSARGIRYYITRVYDVSALQVFRSTEDEVWPPVSAETDDIEQAKRFCEAMALVDGET